MIQPQWPGLGPSSPPTPFPGATTGATPFPTSTAFEAADGVSPGWWNGGGFGSTFGSGSTGSSMFGVLQSLVSMLEQLVNGLMNGAGTTGGFSGMPSANGYTGIGPGGGGQIPGSPGFSPLNNGQAPPCAANGRCADDGAHFREVTISSTGDPHIAETGTQRTAGGDVRVEERYDSMASHADLADARSVAGGYRVATTVTQPGNDGVTYNAAAAVYANGGRDAVTMRRDGSVSVTSDGATESIARGQSLRLSGGETVTDRADGSLSVSGSNGRGGSIDTTMRVLGSGVDVTVHGANISLGGDVVGHEAGAGWEPSIRPMPVRDAEAVGPTEG